MKQKDVVYAFIAVVILMAAGYLGYTQLMPKKTTAPTAIEVEVVGKIPSTLDEAGLAAVTDPVKAVDYNPAVDFSGLGNTAPFGK